MPFGLTNAPATFQVLMDELLEPLKEFVAGLLDDMAVWADSKKELHERILKLFGRLHDFGMVLTTKKTNLFVDQGIFLGFQVNKDGIYI